MLKWLAWAVLGLLMLAAPFQAAQAQGAPFNCDVVFYQMRNAGGQSQMVKFSSVGPTVTPTGVYGALQATQLNSIGYNPVDNYIYGLSTATGAPQLYRIGTTGYQLVGTIANGLAGGLSLAGFTPTAGVFDAGGRYYFAGQAGANISPAAIFRVDSIPATGAIQVSHQYNLTPTVVTNMGDFDFNGAGGPSGLLLGTVGFEHHRITLTPSGSNPAQGTASVTTATLAFGGTVGAVGSAFYDAFAQKFYVFNNTNNDFWEITNPQAGSSSAVLTNAAAYVGPPAFPGPFTPTDGTSCPISGSRVADLGITKTDGVSSLPSGAVTSYTITVINAGPYPANYAVVRDPPAPGLRKLSVSCSAPGGPPTAVCPATLATSTFETGVQVLTFPPDTTLVFTVNAEITATAGSNVTNTATVAPASDTTDPNTANNTATDADAVSATTATVVSAPAICPANRAESLVNRVVNGDFASTTPLSASATIGGLNTYVAANSVSPQTGSQTYLASGILQNPFPGDAGRSVSAEAGWLLSNGKTGGAASYRAWFQAVGGLTVGQTYEFMAYVSNATRPGTTSPTVPDLRLQVSNGGTATLATITPANETVGTGDVWTLIQGTFSATLSTVTLSISNFRAASAEPGGGDVAGIAQVQLRSCEPSPDVSLTKTNGTNTIVSTGTTAYTVTVTNPSAITATTTLIVDPAVANLAKTTITCVVTAPSQCPAALTVLALEGSGLTIPVIRSGGGTVVFRITANVTGPPGETATNIVTISGVGYTDADPTNNQAQDVDAIIGTANLGITKVNSTTAITSGFTTSYTITVSNLGPSVVNNAVLQDPIASGLSCSAVTCTAAIGTAACPTAAATTMPLLQGTGVVLPTMSSGSSLVFRLDCLVNATGQ